MKKEKSKILKLKKKYNALKWFREKGAFISALSLATLSGIGMISSLIFNLPLWICLTSCTLFVGTFVYPVCYDLLDELIKKKIIKINNKIEVLSNSDEIEKEILNKFNAMEELKDSTKIQVKAAKTLIKEMIMRKNLDVKNQNKLIKELTKKKQAEAEQEVIKELEQQETPKYKDFSVQDFRDDL